VVNNHPFQISVADGLSSGTTRQGLDCSCRCGSSQCVLVAELIQAITQVHKSF